MLGGSTGRGPGGPASERASLPMVPTVPGHHAALVRARADIRPSRPVPDLAGRLDRVVRRRAVEVHQLRRGELALVAEEVTPSPPLPHPRRPFERTAGPTA